MKEIRIQKDRATTRMGHLPVEGGGLNAGYDVVDAVANICTTAGNLGMKYGRTLYGPMLDTKMQVMTLKSVSLSWSRRTSMSHSYN